MHDELRDAGKVLSVHSSMILPNKEYLHVQETVYMSVLYLCRLTLNCWAMWIPNELSSPGRVGWLWLRRTSWGSLGARWRDLQLNSVFWGGQKFTKSRLFHCAGNISKHIAMWFSFAIFTRNYNEPEDIPSMHSLPSFGFDDVNMNIYSNYDVTIWLCITMAVGFHRTEKISRIGISETWHVCLLFFPPVLCFKTICAVF